MVEISKSGSGEGSGRVTSRPTLQRYFAASLPVATFEEPAVRAAWSSSTHGGDQRCERRRWGQSLAGEIWVRMHSEHKSTIFSEVKVFPGCRSSWFSMVSRTEV